MTMHPSELNRINPCHGCARRHVGCQSGCAERAEWKKLWAEFKAREHKQRAADMDDPHRSDPHVLRRKKEPRR